MEIKSFLKHLNQQLKNKSCSQIEFYEPQTVAIQDKDLIVDLKDVFKVHFLNSDYKFINFYFKFDENDWLIKANNQSNLTYFLDLSTKDKDQINELKDFYLSKSSNLGLNQLPLGLQLGPILFLEKINDGQIHIFIYIIKHKNIANQSITNYDCLFIDNQEEFFNKFLLM